MTSRRRSGLPIVNLNPRPRTLAGCRAIRDALLAVDPTLEIPIVHWPEVLAGALTLARPRAVVLGPNDTPFPAYPPAFDALLGWIRRRRGPTLGICGGHQALALAHGAPVGPVMPVPAASESYEGMPRVSGVTRIRLLGDLDPLLEGLPPEVDVAVSHVDEVKEIPPGFRLLAVGDPCHIQILRADRRPLYGLQFHPERRAPGDAGGRILRNFLGLLLRI